MTLRGFVPKPEDVERFWSKVDKNGPIPSHRPDLGPCWLWKDRPTTKGYGQIKIGNRKVHAHRFAYQIKNGPLDSSLTTDHLCRVRRCVNYDHLEAVTSQENTLRGVGITAIQARKEYCCRGHLFSTENIYCAPGATGRRCRACQAMRKGRNGYWEKKKARCALEARIGRDE